jgi:predicted acylesterase/phospholipase RssA
MTGRERALIIGSGGASGNAWAIGVVAGLFDAQLDVTEADLIVGTSAGSTAAAQITSTMKTPNCWPTSLPRRPSHKLVRRVPTMDAFRTGRRRTIWK